MSTSNCVYILSCKNDRYYVGSTKELEDRMARHRAGKVKATRHIRPVRLVFYQSYDTIQKARKIEYWLKQQKSRDLLERIIGAGVIKKNIE